MTRVAVLGDATKAMGSITEAECRRLLAAIDLAEQLTGADRVVRPLGGGQDRHGLRQREPRLGGSGAAPARRAHAARRRGQRRGRRHQRRGPAVLERRGDDADAHQGHPRHDPRQRDGAHGQAGDRLLRRRVRRGQLRHRRLRADHGAQRRGPVLGAQPPRGVRRPVRPLRPDVPGPRRALAAPGRRPTTPSIATSGPSRTRSRASTSRRSATSSPTPPTPTARSPSTSAP